MSEQELAYKYQLIELYGTPYSDDIGTGKTYKQGYDGPDLFHYKYVDEPAGMDKDSLTANYAIESSTTHKIDIQTLKGKDANSLIDINKWQEINKPITTIGDDNNYDIRSKKLHFSMVNKAKEFGKDNIGYELNNSYVEFVLNHHGFVKRGYFKGRRRSPGTPAPE